MKIYSSATVVVLAALSMGLGGCAVIAGAKDALRDTERTAPYSGPTREAAATIEPDVTGLLQLMLEKEMPDCTRSTTAGPRPEYVCKTRVPSAVLGSGDFTAKFLDRSMVVIDTNCAGYLSSLDRMGATSRFSRSQVNAVFNYVAVLMAMAGDDPEQLGYLNAAAGLFNTSADNLETLVLISPTPSRLTPLVEQAQAAARQQLPGIRVANTDERLSSAVRWVQQYAAMCTPRGIRQLLDDAIDTETEDGTTPPQVIDAARRLGPGIAIVLAKMAPQATDTDMWKKLLQDQRVLGAVVWLIRDPKQVVGDDPKAQARQAYLEGLLGKPLYDTLMAALADTKQGPILAAMISGANEPVYDEMVKTTQAAEQQAGASTTVAIAEAEKDQAVRASEDAKKLAAAAETDRDKAIGAANEKLKTLCATLADPKPDVCQAP